MGSGQWAVGSEEGCPVSIIDVDLERRAGITSITGIPNRTQTRRQRSTDLEIRPTDRNSLLRSDLPNHPHQLVERLGEAAHRHVVERFLIRFAADFYLQVVSVHIRTA